MSLLSQNLAYFLPVLCFYIVFFLRYLTAYRVTFLRNKKTFSLFPVMLVTCWFFLIPSVFGKESSFVVTKHTTASLITYTNTITANKPLLVGIYLRLAQGWHTYWRNPGDAGDPANITVTAQGAFNGSTKTILWPTPLRIREGNFMSYAYTGDVLLPLLLSLTPDPHEIPKRETTLKAHAHWIVCAQLCIPEEANFTLTLPTGAEQPSRQAILFDDVARASPKPSPYQATVTSRGILTIFGKKITPYAFTDAWFLPQERGQIVNATPQKSIIRQGSLVLHLQPDTAFPKNKTLTGVLVLKDYSGHIKAFNISAQPVSTLPLPQKFSLYHLIELLFCSFAGGIMLNLMPCVFPILAMKALVLVRSNDTEQHHQRLAALRYSAGVLIGFISLGSLIMGLRTVGTQIGWGFQLQSPLFVTLMCWFLFCIALNFLDVFTISGPSFSLSTHSHYFWNDIVTGLLAVVVASPCTAPFMGVALAGALTFSPLIGLLIFTTLGIGMALPFLLLAYVQNLAKYLPKPGPWMIYIKQFLAFPLFASCLWLLWVATLEGTQGTTFLFVSSGLLFLSFAAWLYGLSQRLTDNEPHWLATTLRGLAVLFVIGSFCLLPALSSQPLEQNSTSLQHKNILSDPHVEPFSQQRLETLHASGKSVLVDITAAWCITCLINEHVTLNAPSTKAALAQNNVILLRGDWTRHNPAITAFLHQHGREGIPFYLFVPVVGKEVVLPQILTPSIIIQTITSTSHNTR